MVKLVIHGKDQELGRKSVPMGEAADLLKLLKEVNNFSFDGITFGYTESTCTLSKDCEGVTEVRIFGGDTIE
jgi:hypothetical protein